MELLLPVSLKMLAYSYCGGKLRPQGRTEATCIASDWVSQVKKRKKQQTFSLYEIVNCVISP